MSKNNELIVISGPTASGKTGLAIELAIKYNIPIFSADSRQLYKEMSIGVAKPSKEELAVVPHYFIDHVSIHQPYNAGIYEDEAIDLLTQHFTKYEKAILVGGTGLYIQSVLHGLDHFPDVPQNIIDELNEFYLQNGLESLLEELKKKDFETFTKIDLQNSRRIIRALSIIRATDHPYSHFTTGLRKERSFEVDYRYIEIDRILLYQRINDRVDEMIRMGLVDEAFSLFPNKGIKALETVGYSELFDHFEGLSSLEQAIDKIKQHSRNYAKRQITWFKKFKP